MDCTNLAPVVDSYGGLTMVKIIYCESPTVRDAIYIGFLHNGIHTTNVDKTERRECTSEVSGKGLEWKILLDVNRRMMHEDNIDVALG